jgi:hypothetical protein
VAATQPIIDLPTRTRVKGVAVSSEATHTNLRTIETGSQVVHNGLLISPLAETTTERGLHLRIDPARPPPSTVYHHVQTFPRMTHGGRLGIGAETTILVTNPVTDTTARTTFRPIVTTALKEIRGGHHTITDRGLLRPLRLDLLEWITLQLPPALLMMHRSVSTPLPRHPRTRLPHPLQNGPYLRNINRYLSPFLRESQLLPSSVGPLHRLILPRPPRLSQRLNQAPPPNLPHHCQSVRNGRDALVRKRSWLMTTRSQDVAQFMIMTLRPSWEKERLGKRLSSTRYFSSDRFSSEVHKAIQRATGKVVALKRILMHNEKEGMPVTALREIKILKALKHPCIINIVDMIVVRG